MLKRPEISIENIKHFIDLDYDKYVLEQVEINTRYEGYIKKANKDAEKMLNLENKLIPDNINYNDIPNIAVSGHDNISTLKLLNKAGLQSLDISNTEINDSGKAESTIIEASKIGKIYSGSESIKIDETTNAISVKEVDANITKTTRQMTVSSAIGDYAANTVIPEGTDIMAILANIFEKTLGITTTEPSASLSLTSGDNAGTYEYGSSINTVWSAALNPGSYTGDGWATSQPTGVTAKTYTWTNASGASNSGTVSIDSLTSTVTVKCTINYDAGNMPVDNKGNELPLKRIAAGSKEASKTYTPAKYWWVGSRTDKYEDTVWDSAKVRGLSLSKQWTSTKTATVTFPAGAKQQVIAVPANTSWTAKDGSGADITATFKSAFEVMVDPVIASI